MSLELQSLAIINRSFWPVYPVIGEALLRLAEQTAKKGVKVSVILQDASDIKAKLNKAKRGQNVKFYPLRALTSSSSNVFFRIFDAFFFMFWVFFILIWTRPQKVYVSTDPPILVPCIVFLYAKLFKAEYFYHLQDIHPEATHTIFPVNKWIFKILLKLDQWNMQGAKCLITINKEMAGEIIRKIGNYQQIVIIANPAVSFNGIKKIRRKKEVLPFAEMRADFREFLWS